jgi:hypothetical protein
MKLFSFWCSLVTYRVRITLNLKRLVPDEVGRARSARRPPRSQSDDGASRFDRRRSLSTINAFARAHPLKQPGARAS